MIGRSAAIAAGLAATLVSSSCWAGNARIYVKPGATSQDQAQALLACKRDVGELAAPGMADFNVQIKEIDSKGRIGPPSLATAVGGALGMAAVQVFVDSEYRRSALPGCMRARGFAAIQLSDPQQQIYQGLPNQAAKAEWEDAFRSSTTAAAYADAMRPKVTPLPSAREEPFVVGAVRFDPLKVKVATTSVKGGDALFVADGYYRLTARVPTETLLSTSINLGKDHPLMVPEGAIYRQTSEGGEGSLGAWEDRTVWCGPAALRGKKIDICFRSRPDGYRFAINPNSPDWYPVISPYFELIAPLATASLVLQESPADTAGPSPFQVALKVDRISEKAIHLRAVAFRGKTEIPFWTGAATFDGSGRAVIPFWTRRLIVTRDGKGISAALEGGGDGSGW
jgi:hypothetical protein